jgi:hypothetical protein
MTDHETERGVAMTVDLIDRLPELEREATEYERKARAIRQIIEGVRTLNGDAARLLSTPPPFGDADTTPPDCLPRGREAVRLIVATRPGVWRVRDIKAENSRRGWPSSVGSIETAVQRLEISGLAKRLRKGVYDFSADNAEAQSVA